MVSSMVLGIVCEMVINRIVFSKTVQKKRRYRVITFVSIFLFFLVAQCVAVFWMRVSMLDYLFEQLIYVVGLPALGFVLNLFIRGFRVRQIKKRYGDGTGGFVFDMKKKEIEEANRQNQPILGEYDTDLAVKLRTGTYVGKKQKKCISYQGIPYAKPPVVELRWKAPEPLPPSDGVFEAVNLGASAIQVDRKGSILKHHRQSEDCLYLNVCVGTQKTKSKKPVLVLFHHGDFTYGGSAEPFLAGDDFVEDHPDIVFVSFNYRLGILGFINFSEVPGGEAYPDTTNLGLLDQIAALEWIRDNIAAFGGDPRRVAVLGFDSGAVSICLLAASGRAKGLFSKAFIFNGSPMHTYDSPEVSKTLAADLLKETRTQTMEELSALSSEALKEAAQKLCQRMCGPTCDGAWIPVDAYSAFREGTASGIEFVVGFPSFEMQVLRAFVGDEHFEELMSAAVKELLEYMDPTLSNAVEEYIKKETEGASLTEARSKLVEQYNALGIYRLAVRLSEGGSKVHLMYWDEKPLIENLGSGTVDAAATLLGNGEALRMYGSVMNEDLSVTLQTLLHKFLTGNALQLYSNEIKGVDAFVWKPYPSALVVSGEKLHCEKIADRLTEVEGLFDFLVT